MYVVIVEFTLNPGCAPAFRERVQQQARDSLELEADCEVFDVCVDPERDDFILLYEVYKDEGAFEAHLASAHFADFDATVTPWVSEKKLSPYRRI
ncbi:MAG: putative quinol monooxygenase [Gammaproteobacteria bacterium]|jgi:quinol monooxygenase YgiN